MSCGRKAAAASPFRASQDGIMPHAALDWRNARLRKHADYQSVYGQSRRHSSATMSYFYRVRGAEHAAAPARVGLTTGRVLGKAVERNRIRRRMREAVRRHLSTLPNGVDVVLHPRKTVLEMEFSRLEEEVGRVFAKVRMAAGRGVETNR